MSIIEEVLLEMFNGRRGREYYDTLSCSPCNENDIDYSYIEDLQPTEEELNFV